LSGEFELEKIMARTEAQEAVVKVLQDEVVTTTLRTVARVKARMAAYEKVAGNYESFIDRQASDLARGAFAESPYKELGIARLVAVWLVEADQYITNNEYLLSETEKTTRQNFVEESFASFPADIREKVVAELEEKKQQLLIWLASRIQLAQQEQQTREHISDAEVVEEDADQL